MGLLDSLIGALASGQDGNAADQGGGRQAAMLSMVVAMLANGQGGGLGSGGGASASGALGGLGDLIGKFTQGGMGDAIGSWIGHGQNAPISGDQLSNVLGTDMIGNIAAQLGLSHGEAASQLSQMLPQVVDHLTPHGLAPEGGLGGIGDIGDLLSNFAAR